MYEVRSPSFTWPMSSPQKRRKEGGAPQGAKKHKIRKKRRYPGVGEQWVEPTPSKQGAGATTTLPPTPSLQTASGEQPLPKLGSKDMAEE